MSAHEYSIVSIFKTVQGEGRNAGTPAIFIRFAGCNMQCTQEREGFNCDTYFHYGHRMNAVKISHKVGALDDGEHPIGLVVLTGGEPCLQIDAALLAMLHDYGLDVAVETNGSVALDALVDVDHLTVSPKIGSVPVLSPYDVSEVRLVLGPHTIPPDLLDWCEAALEGGAYAYVSPAARAPGKDDIRGHRASEMDFVERNFKRCLAWTMSDPRWRISLQMHKILSVP